MSLQRPYGMFAIVFIVALSQCAASGVMNVLDRYENTTETLPAPPTLRYHRSERVARDTNRYTSPIEAYRQRYGGQEQTPTPPQRYPTPTHTFPYKMEIQLPNQPSDPYPNHHNPYGASNNDYTKDYTTTTAYIPNERLVAPKPHVAKKLEKIREKINEHKAQSGKQKKTDFDDDYDGDDNLYKPSPALRQLKVEKIAPGNFKTEWVEKAKEYQKRSKQKQKETKKKEKKIEKVSKASARKSKSKSRETEQVTEKAIAERLVRSTTSTSTTTTTTTTTTPAPPANLMRPQTQSYGGNYYTPPFPATMPQAPEPLLRNPHNHIHNCIMKDFHKFWEPPNVDPRSVPSGHQSLLPIQSADIQSTCRVYIEQIEDLSRQCRGAIDKLRSAAGSGTKSSSVARKEARKDWWKQVPFDP